MDKLDVGEDGAHPSAHLTELRARNKQLKIDLSSLRAELKAAGETAASFSQATLVIRDQPAVTSFWQALASRLDCHGSSELQPGESTTYVAGGDEPAQCGHPVAGRGQSFGLMCHVAELRSAGVGQPTSSFCTNIGQHMTSICQAWLS